MLRPLFDAAELKRADVPVICMPLASVIEDPATFTRVRLLSSPLVERLNELPTVAPTIIVPKATEGALGVTIRLSSTAPETLIVSLPSPEPWPAPELVRSVFWTIIVPVLRPVMAVEAL